MLSIRSSLVATQILINVYLVSTGTMDSGPREDLTSATCEGCKNRAVSLRQKIGIFESKDEPAYKDKVVELFCLPDDTSCADSMRSKSRDDLKEMIASLTPLQLCSKYGPCDDASFSWSGPGIGVVIVTIILILVCLFIIWQVFLARRRRAKSQRQQTLDLATTRRV